jgi:hypothetical protein
MNNKLDLLLKEISLVYHLNDEYISDIQENILLRANFYKNVKINFDNETIYVNNSSTSLDFFINRLIHNIRNYLYTNVYNPNNVEDEDYDVNTQTLKISNINTIGDISINKLKNRMPDVTPEIANIVNKKIISHEFGHALQTSYSGIVGTKDNKYKELIQNLNTKYPNIFIVPYYEQKLVMRQNGLIPVDIQDGKDGIRQYYANKERIILIDDIFDEDEALQIYKLDRVQGKYELGQDCYKNIFNYESNNYKITTYARMMKYILGSNKSFRIMYQDGIEFYEFFDQFEKLATEIFKNGVESKKPVVSCILDALERIKKNNSIKDILNLDLFFTRCLEKRVKYFFKENLSKEEINGVKKIVNEFSIILTKCRSGKLDHDYVMDNIRKIINKY